MSWTVSSTRCTSRRSTVDRTVSPPSRRASDHRQRRDGLADTLDTPVRRSTGSRWLMKWHHYEDVDGAARGDHVSGADPARSNRPELRAAAAAIVFAEGVGGRRALNALDPETLEGRLGAPSRTRRVGGSTTGSFSMPTMRVVDAAWPRSTTLLLRPLWRPGATRPSCALRGCGGDLALPGSVSHRAGSPVWLALSRPEPRFSVSRQAGCGTWLSSS